MAAGSDVGWVARARLYWLLGQERAREMSGAIYFGIPWVNAFVAVGALDETEAEGWRERFRAPARLTAPSVPEPVRARSASVLRELLSNVEPLDRPEMSGQEVIDEEAMVDSLTRYHQFKTGLAALQEVGAVSEDEARSWAERADRRAGQPTDAERIALGRARTCTAVDLVGVVPGPEETRDGLKILAVELYADGGIIVWHKTVEVGEPRPSSPSEMRELNERRRQQFPRLKVSDDLRTDYFVGGGGHGGISSDAVIGHSRFAPAIPPEARSLTVADGECRFEISLSG